MAVMVALLAFGALRDDRSGRCTSALSHTVREQTSFQVPNYRSRSKPVGKSGGFRMFGPLVRAWNARI